MAAWLSLVDARKLWRDAPADDLVLTSYLEAAKAAMIAYANPADILAEDVVVDEDGYIVESTAVIPESWPVAQAIQARNIWNSGKASPSGEFDGSSYAISAYPLDWQVQQILRPRRAIGAVV